MSIKNDSINLQKSLIFICTKIQLHSYFFCEYHEDIANLLLLVLGMPGHTHHKQQFQLVGKSEVYQQTKNQLNPSPFSRDITDYIWLVKNILVDNSRTRILSDRSFAMKSQELKEFSFCNVFRKINLQHLQNTLFLGPFWSNLDRNEFSRKIGLSHSLVPTVP